MSLNIAMSSVKTYLLRLSTLTAAAAKYALTKITVPPVKTDISAAKNKIFRLYLGDVAVNYRRVLAVFRKMVMKRLRNGNTSVLAACAAYADYKLALALAYV